RQHLPGRHRRLHRRDPARGRAAGATGGPDGEEGLIMRTTRFARLLPLAVGVALVVVLALLPLLNLSIPGVLPGPTYTPGSLALMSLCMVFAALALSYNLLLGTAGMLSFGHALYFGAGAYGLGIVLRAA